MDYLKHPSVKAVIAAIIFVLTIIGFGVTYPDWWDEPAPTATATTAPVEWHTPTAAPSFTPTPLPPTRTATLVHPTDTAAPPAPTSTATTAPAPTDTPAPLPVVLVTTTDAKVRTGDSTDYPALVLAAEGMMFEPIARNEAGSWFYVHVKCNTYFGWIAASVIDFYQGDVSSAALLPVRESPPFMPISPISPIATPMGGGLICPGE